MQKRRAAVDAAASYYNMRVLYFIIADLQRFAWSFCV